MAENQKNQQRGDQQGGTPHHSLEEREYRDKEGNVHHHTNTYMEQHNVNPGRGGQQNQAGGNENRGGQENRGGR